MTLRVLTYNIRKGIHPWRKRCLMAPLARRVSEFSPDILLLQEFPGEHRGRFEDQSSMEKISRGAMSFRAYSQSLRTRVGHHGNAILSRFPILEWESRDLSSSWIDRRSMVAARVSWDAQSQKVWVLSVHLGLLTRWRMRQLEWMRSWLESLPSEDCVIVGGDFNDWDLKVHDVLTRELGMIEVHEAVRGSVAPTFPARFPVLKLDRIYVRGLDVCDAVVIAETREEESDEGVDALSDHLALFAGLVSRSEEGA